MGYFWTLLNPLLMMSVMAVVFSALFKVDLKAFALFLFAGMIPWNFFSAVVTQSGTAFIQNEGLIKKIYLPKGIFPLSVALALLIDSVLSFIALFIIIVAIGGPVTMAILFIPVAYSLLFVFAIGVGLIMSVATVFFRDLQHVTAIVMQGLFFVTPVFYKPEALVNQAAWILQLNPIVPFIELFRAPLHLGQFPSANTILLAAMISVSSLLVGLMVFLKQEKKLVFRL
jgi:ABC-type polysaccharide/polyol phosphate export permease